MPERIKNYYPVAEDPFGQPHMITPIHDGREHVENELQATEQIYDFLSLVSPHPRHPDSGHLVSPKHAVRGKQEIEKLARDLGVSEDKRIYSAPLGVYPLPSKN